MSRKKGGAQADPRWSYPIEPAPGDLRIVQALIITGTPPYRRGELASPRALADWLERWGLLDRDSELAPADVEQAAAVRSALEALVRANHGPPPAPEIVQTLDRAAAAAPRRTRFAADGSARVELLTVVRNRRILVFSRAFGLATEVDVILPGDVVDVSGVEGERIQRVDHTAVVGEGMDGLQRPQFGISQVPSKGRQTNGVGNGPEGHPEPIEGARDRPVATACLAGRVRGVEVEANDLGEVVGALHERRVLRFRPARF